MSQTSASEPPILATQVGVLEHLEETETIQPYVRNHLFVFVFVL
jgi:hypothetical protein